MSETTSEQLVEIEGQTDTVQVREGRWRTRGGDIRNVTPRPAGDGRKDLFPWWDAAYGCTWTSGGRYYLGKESPLDLLTYLGPIEEQPQPQAEPVQVREGRWRTRNGEIKDIRPCDPLEGPYFVWPWTDGVRTFQDNGRHRGSKDSANDLVEYLGPIEQQPEPVPQPESDTELQAQVAFLKGREVTLGTRLQQEKQVTTRLREELATQAETMRRLQIELDAAQQVPEAIVDRFREGLNLGTARAVETIAEWLQPIRLVDSAYLANATMQHLPQIMRHLTGLDSHAID